MAGPRGSVRSRVAAPRPRSSATPAPPYTDHPGSGEPSGPDARYGDYLADGGGYPNVGQGWGGRGGLGDRPRVGPWREWHLDGFKAPPTRPAVILDPFGGVGTTAMVARALGRVGISVDLSHDFGRAARWRIFHSPGAAKALARTNRERQGALDLAADDPRPPDLEVPA